LCLNSARRVGIGTVQEGAPFSFNFHARFAMEAKSAPSSLYDHYNPEVAAEVAPRAFRIR
jgi:hypothetical protein